MNRQCALLAVMLLLNQDIVTSHILTSSRDLPLPTCVRLLTFAVRELCMYGDIGEASDEYAPSVGSRELENRRVEMSMHVAKRCCLQPCTLPELMSIC